MGWRCYLREERRCAVSGKLRKENLIHEKLNVSYEGDLLSETDRLFDCITLLLHIHHLSYVSIDEEADI